MKWMRWSWDDLQDCPADLIPVIHQEMRDEADAQKRANARKR